MSLEIKKKIILNTNNSRSNDRVIIKKGSIKTIILEVTINDKGGVLELPLGTSAKVRMRKPDGKQVLNDCTVNGNTVNVEVTEQMQTTPGDGECEVILLYGQGTLTSATFPITIERNVHDDSQLESLPEYNTLINALVRIEDAVPKAEQAYVVAMEAQEIVDNIQNEFTQMQTVNANAVNAANTAATNANGKATLANNAADIANTKASAANTAATNANNAADSAKSAATNASSMAELAETAASNANSIANTIEQKLSNGEFNGTDGVSPSITVKTNTGTTYVLEITDAVNTITTPNLKGKDGTGAGDMTSSVYDPQGKAVDVFEYIDGVATQLYEDVDTWRGSLIVDNLASELTDKALSAKQGCVLDEKITTLNESLPYIALDGTSYTSLYSCIADMKNNSHPIIISWSPKNDFPVLFGGRWTFEVSKFNLNEYTQIIATYKGDNENPNVFRTWIGKIPYNSSSIIWEEIKHDEILVNEPFNMGTTKSLAIYNFNGFVNITCISSGVSYYETYLILSENQYSYGAVSLLKSGMSKDLFISSFGIVDGAPKLSITNNQVNTQITMVSKPFKTPFY